jgi:hypothetical protein
VRTELIRVAERAVASPECMASVRFEIAQALREFDTILRLRMVGRLRLMALVGIWVSSNGTPILSVQTNLVIADLLEKDLPCQRYRTLEQPKSCERFDDKTRERFTGYKSHTRVILRFRDSIGSRG